MNCQSCDSSRVAVLTSKANDCHFLKLGNKEHVGYLPRGLGIGGGDYVDIKACLDCGQLQGEWPRPVTDFEDNGEDE